MAKKKSSSIIVVIVILVISLGLVTTIGGFAIWQFTKINNLNKKIETYKTKSKELQERIDELKTSKKSQGDSNEKSSEPKTKKEKQSKKTTKQFGYIKDVYLKKGKYYLIINYAQWMVGDEADKAAVEDGIIPAGEHVDNDYYIRDKNNKLRTFEIANSSIALMKTYNESGVINPKKIKIEQFAEIWDSLDHRVQILASAPYWVWIKDKTVTKIEEQFVP